MRPRLSPSYSDPTEEMVLSIIMDTDQIVHCVACVSHVNEPLQYSGRTDLEQSSDCAIETAAEHTFAVLCSKKKIANCLPMAKPEAFNL
jgi:hypothetical protein